MVIVLSLSLFVALNSSYSHWLAYGQMVAINGSVGNNTELEFTTNRNVSTNTSQDNPHIMENTSGMIDEAFNALKDTFESLFGK
jgi:hypothetical protein